MSSLLKGAIKLFHGAVKDFDSFDSKFATETAFGKGFSFTPDEKIAKDYAEITPSKIKKLWGKEHVEAALERKKDGIPILYEVEASIRTNELLLARKNFKDQNKQVKTKLNKLIKEEKIVKRSNKLGMLCFSTPFDETAVDFLEKINVPAYKISSFENVHLPLIKKVAQTGKPVIVSTGLASKIEIEEAVEALKIGGCNQFALLKCTSSYPAEPKDINLKTIIDMRKVIIVFGIIIVLLLISYVYVIILY